MEVDAAKELISQFDMQCEDGKWITVYVEYDWKPSVCTNCKVFGHSLVQCSVKQASSKLDGKGAKGSCQDDWVEVHNKKKKKNVEVGSGVNRGNEALVLKGNCASRQDNSAVDCALLGTVVPVLNENSQPTSQSKTCEIVKQVPDLVAETSRDPSPIRGGTYAGQIDTLISTPTGKVKEDGSEPQTASPDLNPFGGRVKDSLERKGLAQKANYGKNKLYSIPGKGTKK